MEKKLFLKVQKSANRYIYRNIYTKQSALPLRGAFAIMGGEETLPEVRPPGPDPPE